MIGRGTMIRPVALIVCIVKPRGVDVNGYLTVRAGQIVRLSGMSYDYPLNSNLRPTAVRHCESGMPRVQDPGVVAFASSRKAAIRFCSVRRLISSISAARLRLPCT